MDLSTEKLLSDARDVILSMDYNYAIIEEPPHIIEPLFTFPRCAISSKVLKVTGVIKSCLREALEMDKEWYIKYLFF